MSFKQQAMDYISALPEDCTVEDLEYFLYVRKAIEEGRQDIKDGRWVTHEEVKKRFAHWRT